MTPTPADPVLRCPHCGGVLVVQPLHVATGDEPYCARAVQSTSTSTSTKNTAARGAATHTTTGELEQGALPLPPTIAKPSTASTWKRAIAIAHAAIDEFPDNGASQTDAFKERCARQGIAYADPGGVDGRPLYARALDYALETRRRRVAGSSR